MSKTRKFNPDAMLSRGMTPVERMRAGHVMRQAKQAADRRQDARERTEPQEILPKRDEVG